MEFIKTTYVPKKGVEPVVQWFLASIPEEWHDMYHHHMNFTGEVHDRNVKKYIDSVNKLSKRDIRFTPIIEPVKDAKHSTAYHCGYDTSKGGIPYRGSFMPRFYITFIYYNIMEKDIACSISSHNYKDITDGMRSSIISWFKEQLQDAATDELVDYLKEQEKRRYLDNTLFKAQQLQKSLDTFIYSLKKIGMENLKAL